MGWPQYWNLIPKQQGGALLNELISLVTYDSSNGRQSRMVEFAETQPKLATITDRDLQHLYELGEEGITEWLNSILPKEPRLALRSEPEVILQVAALLDNFGWQIQQAELKKSIEFESIVRKCQTKLDEINVRLRDLKLGRGNKGVPPITEQLEDLESRADRLRSTLYTDEIERLKELVKHKASLERQRQVLMLERGWRDSVSRMESAMTKDDLDGAQGALEALDEALERDWHDDLAKRSTLEGLRDRLVSIIQGL